MNEYRKLIKPYIKGKSISTDSSFQNGIDETVEFLKDLFLKHDFRVDIVTGYDNPIIVAYYEVDPKVETCLIYGHYDVQPADKSDGWMFDPFSATEFEGRFYCRGAIDNKGQNLIHIVNIFKLIKEKKLKFNVKFMIEGNEETGSPKIESFIKHNKELLKSDFVMISDGEIVSNLPTIEVGFRGGFNAELKITTSSTDMHSGIFGGAVPNAIHELSIILSKLYDSKTYKVNIEGFYDDVEEIEENILKNNRSIPFSIEEYMNLTGTFDGGLLLEEGIDYYTAVSLKPTVHVTGINSGYTGIGFRNSISGSAVAKINFRLVLNQEPDKIIKLFKKFLDKEIPKYVKYELITTNPYNGIKVDIKNKWVERAYSSLEQAFGNKPIYKYCGGGLPIVTFFSDILRIPNVLIPLANEDCKMHAANENFSIEQIKKSLEFSRIFFSK